MALIKCPGCNREVSNTDERCPHCGYSLRKTILTNSYNQKTTYHEDTGSYGCGWALGFLLGLIGLVIALAINKSETTRGAIHGFLTQLIIGLVVGFIAGCAIFSMRV